MSSLGQVSVLKNLTSTIDLFSLARFNSSEELKDFRRFPAYSMVWLTKGAGKIISGHTIYPFESPVINFFSPYQPVKVEFAEGVTEGTILLFHPDFYNPYHQHQEIPANGILFNNPYQPPFIYTDSSKDLFDRVFIQMNHELEHPGLAQHELLEFYLKILLIASVRMKGEQFAAVDLNDLQEKEKLHVKFRNLLEVQFNKVHTPKLYAELLQVPLNVLSASLKKAYHKTVTELINEKILLEATKELFLSDKPVKEIGFDLGFNNELLFEEFFTSILEVSPENYRLTLGLNTDKKKFLVREVMHFPEVTKPLKTGS